MIKNLGIATEKAKGITLKAKEKVSESVSDNSESPVNYAVDKVQKKIYGISSSPEFHVVEFSYK